MKYELEPIDKFAVNDAVMVKCVTVPTRRMDMAPYDKPLRVISNDDKGGAMVINSAGDLKVIYRGNKVGEYKRKTFLLFFKYWKLEYNN